MYVTNVTRSVQEQHITLKFLKYVYIPKAKSVKRALN